MSNINEVLKTSKISVTITAEDLHDFAKEVATETIAICNGIQQENPVWLTPDQVAERLQVTRCTLWRWGKENYLPAYKFGNRTRFKLSDVVRIEEAEKGGKR